MISKIEILACRVLINNCNFVVTWSTFLDLYGMSSFAFFSRCILLELIFLPVCQLHIFYKVLNQIIDLIILLKQVERFLVVKDYVFLFYSMLNTRALETEYMYMKSTGNPILILSKSSKPRTLFQVCLTCYTRVFYFCNNYWDNNCVIKPKITCTRW